MTTERETQPISVFGSAAREDPYPVYATLREEYPVYREPAYGTYVLTRFKDVYDVLKDHGRFSSALGISPGLQSNSGAMMTTMITSDPPRHTRLRALVNRSFTPRVLESLEPWLVTLVDDILDSWEAGRDIDVVHALTVPIPVAAIARLLGISAEDTERFKDWSDAVVGATDGGLPEESRQKIGDMMRYFAAEIAERRQAPRNDLVSTITFAEVDGERLTDLEMLGFCLLLLVAGNETTTNLLSNLLAVLAQKPDLWAALRDDPSRVSAAVDEALRFDSPVQMLFRSTTTDMNLHGVEIPAGSRVAVAYAAANRDPREFADPDEFSLDRDLKQHLAFGYGIHYCLGAPLARLEARVALERLIARFAKVAPGDSPGRRVPSSILRGFSSLPLRFSR